jgi:thiol-disulfide isomerase/thioredoxin
MEQEIIYLTADWCAPCKWFSPVVNEALKEFPGITLSKMDVDQLSPEEYGMIGVTTVPTLIFTTKGIEQSRIIGAVTASKLRSWIREFT